MTTERNTGSNRIAIWGIVLGLAMILIYWLSTRGESAWVSWNTLTAIVLGAIGVAAGAAVGSSEEIRRWTTWESILAAVLAGQGTLNIVWVIVAAAPV